MHACLSNENPNLLSNFNSENLVKRELHRAVSLRFGLKEGKIAMDITKFVMHSYLPNGHLNLQSNFKS